MTRKLTDEQVKAINSLFETARPMLYRHKYYIECGMVGDIKIQINTNAFCNEYYVTARFGDSEPFINKGFLPQYKAIAYAEHLLNQRYQWLPQNDGWIMSGEVITYKTAGKVLELLAMVDFTDHMFYEEQYGCKGDWYNTFGGTTGNDCMPRPSDFNEESQFTIDADSPIWDAVKGVE